MRNRYFALALPGTSAVWAAVMLGLAAGVVTAGCEKPAPPAPSPTASPPLTTQAPAPVETPAPAPTAVPTTPEPPRAEPPPTTLPPQRASGRTSESRDVAGAIEWLLSDQASWVTGQVLVVDGGLGRVRSD